MLGVDVWSNSPPMLSRLTGVKKKVLLLRRVHQHAFVFLFPRLLVRQSISLVRESSCSFAPPPRRFLVLAAIWVSLPSQTGSLVVACALHQRQQQTAAMIMVLMRCAGLDPDRPCSLPPIHLPSAISALRTFALILLILLPILGSLLRSRQSPVTVRQEPPSTACRGPPITPILVLVLHNPGFQPPHCTHGASIQGMMTLPDGLQCATACAPRHQTGWTRCQGLPEGRGAYLQSPVRVAEAGARISRPHHRTSSPGI